MAFRFKRNEAVETAVQRIAQERIACALKRLQADDELEAVHRVRMEIKKVRAILRLVHRASAGNQYTRQTAVLREAAKALGPVRDAHVALKALTELLRCFKGQLQPRSFKQVKRPFQERCRQATIDFAKQSGPKSVTQKLRKVSQGFRGFPLRSHTPTPAGTALRGARVGSEILYRKAYRFC